MLGGCRLLSMAASGGKGLCFITGETLQTWKWTPLLALSLTQDGLVQDRGDRMVVSRILYQQLNIQTPSKTTMLFIHGYCFSVIIVNSKKEIVH